MKGKIRKFTKPVCMVWFFPSLQIGELNDRVNRGTTSMSKKAVLGDLGRPRLRLRNLVFTWPRHWNNFLQRTPLSSWIEKQDPTLHAAYMENRKHSVDFLPSFFFQDVNNMLRTRNSKRKKQAKWMAMIGRLPNNFKSPLSLKGLPFTAWSMRLVALAGVDTPWSQRESQISTSLTGMWDPKIYRKLNPTTMELHLVQQQSKKNRWNGPIVENM